MDKILLAGCIIREDDKILLLHRIKRNWYELPGGKIDDGENPEQAAMREIKEELCCDVEITDKFGEKDFQEDGYIMGYIWFNARIIGEAEPKIGESDKFDHFKYLAIKDLKKYNLSYNMMQNLVEKLV